MHIDKKLLKACAKNKRKAQEELYKACFDLLMPLCKRFHKNDEDARAVFNEAFIKIINNLPKLELDTLPFTPWARKVMNNTLIDEYRRNRKYKEKISKQENEGLLEFLGGPVNNHIEAKIGEDNIMSLLDYLKPNTKHVFILYVIEGYTHKEIAEMMEMSEGTSKWHLSVARKQLRELLIKQEKTNLDNFAI